MSFRTHAARITLLVGLIAAAVATQAQAQPQSQTVLRLVTLSPPQSFLSAGFMKPWAQRMTEQSKGQLRIDVFDGMTLADNLNVIDRVKGDVINMAWGLQIYGGGKYVFTDVVSLPFIASTAESGSVALWRLYARGLLAREYDDIKPLILLSVPQQQVHTISKAVQKLEDLRGLKLRAAAKVTTQIITALGATPISINVGEMYEALQRGTVDGTVMPWTAFPPFKLQEVTKIHVDAALGSSPAMIFMSRKKFDSLPADVRKVIDDNSGEAATREFAKIWDGVQIKVRADVKALPGHTVVELPEAEFARWRERLQPIREAWIKSVPGSDKIVDAYIAEVTKLEAEAKK